MTTVPARAGALAAAVLLCIAAPAAAPADAAADAAAGARHFANCTALNKVYKHGVGQNGAHDHVSGHSRPVTTFTRSNALYAANKKSDRDHDKIACEKR
ncbi:excalibur calcium-binding domain-containing protein [uncultured Jatrophihabitans sp.]|uniref:excalibur calcium-binding domain-containing protein n=1 Tax=uncultured Jatrophihabitans sp. TaxID=1610747 RepID=UPI0035CA243E